MNFKTFFNTLLCSFMLNCSVSASQKLIDKQAPLFSAQAAFADGCICPLNLQDYIGKYKIVLYFYPMDNTPGCSKQAQIFRDNIAKLERHSIQVIGVSCDSIQSHQKFQQQHQLPFPLVSDSRWKRMISKMYGAAGFLYSKRKTFLINKQGVIIKVFENIDIQNQIEDILKSFKH